MTRRYVTISASGGDRKLRERLAREDEAQERHAMRYRREMRAMIARQRATLHELEAPLRALQRAAQAERERDAELAAMNEAYLASIEDTQ